MLEPLEKELKRQFQVESCQKMIPWGEIFRGKAMGTHSDFWWPEAIKQGCKKAN